jgi:hypothetical protein
MTLRQSAPGEVTGTESGGTMSADFRACQDGRSRPSGSWWANLGTHRGESPNRRLVFVDEISGYCAATSQLGSVSYSSRRGSLLRRKTHGATRRTMPERCAEWYHTPQVGVPFLAQICWASAIMPLAFARAFMMSV